MIDEKEIARMRALVAAEGAAQVYAGQTTAEEGQLAASVPALLDEVERLRGVVAEYENGCHHAWKALPTRYDVVLDEHMAAGETRADVNRRASWIETAIRDMGGDLERAESKLRALWAPGGLADAARQMADALRPRGACARCTHLGFRCDSCTAVDVYDKVKVER